MKKLLFITCLIAEMLVSCSGDNEALFYENVKNFSGDKKIIVDDITKATWKFYGFGSRDKKEIRKVRSGVRKDAYIIHFQDDGHVSGTTSTNEFLGEYIVEGNNICIKNISTSKIGETGDGDEYCSALLLCSQYLLSDNQLILYYNINQNYLIFNPVNP